MILGMDCSIRDVAIVASDGNVLVSMKLPLSLQSDINDVVQVAKWIVDGLTISSYDSIYVDYSYAPMRARRRQTAINTMLITAIVTRLDIASYTVDPATIRKWLGLSARASKLDVWTQEPYTLGLATEHEKDAYILARYGLEKGIE